MNGQQNPWRTISPDDYEGHMGSPCVNQLDLLSQCLQRGLQKYSPREVAVIGCGTGNGLEHVDVRCTRKTTVVDINAAFLEVLRRRFDEKIPGLEVIHEDLRHCELSSQYAFIFAGLVFEFLDFNALLEKISNWLKQDGIFKVVLQISSRSLPEVSDSKYTSLKSLKKIVQLVDVDAFKKRSTTLGLREIESYIEKLESGKSFYIGTYRKMNPNKRATPTAGGS